MVRSELNKTNWWGLLVTVFICFLISTLSPAKIDSAKEPLASTSQ